MTAVFIDKDTRAEADALARVWRIRFCDTHAVTIQEMGNKFRVIRKPRSGAVAAGAPTRLSVNDAEHPSAAPDNLQPLLDLIGEAETNGHYNAIFGDVENTNPNLLIMSIDDVLKLQLRFLHQGSPSSAVGRYQILRSTLKDLKKRLKLEGTELFDEPGQDCLAKGLLQRRGLDAYLVGAISRDRFVDNLAMEWATLPNTTGKSHYDGDGPGKARVSLPELEAAVEALRQ